MKLEKIINIIKSKSFLLLLVSILLLISLIINLVLFKLGNEKPKNPYDIEISDNDNFVFLGDSITDFYPLDELYDDLPVINSGVSGYTTDDILKNIDQMVYIYNPTKVFILIGTNDIQQGKTNDEILDNIKKITKKILEKRPNTKIYIESVYPINNTEDEKINHDMVGDRTNKTIKDLNKKIKGFCLEKNYTYINVYKELLDDDGNLALKYTAEGLHLSDLGYLKVTRLLYRYL